MLQPITSTSDRIFRICSENGPKFTCNYDHHATLAFNITFKEICDIENPRKPGKVSGTMAVPAIAYWFLTLESFLNTQLRICCAVNGEDEEKQLLLSVTQKVLSLIDMLELDKAKFNELEIIGKVHELAQFRNVLFTERYREKEMIFRKTGFSNYPLHANIVDLLETLLIVLEVTGRLNLVFPGIRTAPLITLSNSRVTVREQLDKCVREILFPCLNAAFEKQHIPLPLPNTLTEYSSVVSRAFSRLRLKECDVPQSFSLAPEQTDPRPTLHCLTRINEFLGEYEKLEMVLD